MLTIEQFKQQIPSFLEIYKVKGSPHTLQAYKSDLAQYLKFLRDENLADQPVVSARLANQFTLFLKSGRRKNATIARMLATLSTYCDYLRCEVCDQLVNPFRNMPIRRNLPGNTDPKPVDPFTLELLLSGIDDLRDRALFRLFVASGLRVSEMRSLNRDSITIFEDVAGTNHSIVGVGEVIGKGRKKRRFYVDHETLIAFAKYVTSRKDPSPALFISQRGTRLSVRGIQYRLGYWCRRFGAPHINVHRLRHSFATQLANNDIDPTVLRTLMGHASFTTTMRYFRLSEKTVRRRYFAAMQRTKRRRNES